jgi:hypothetical protein
MRVGELLVPTGKSCMRPKVDLPKRLTRLSQRDSMIVARHEVSGPMRKITPPQRDD